ncbi:MAG: ERF family protein [Flavobacteriaceae bacterium]
MKKLAEALNSAMTEIKGLEKDMQVGNTNYGGYKGISDYEVKKLYKPIFEKNGLMIIPTSVNAKTVITRWEEKNEYQGKITIKQKQSVFTEAETKYLLLHISGESIELGGYGQGVDPQDKGAGKATTYALKYVLLYLTLTPTGKIDDTDNTHSNDIPDKKETTKQKPVQKKTTQATKPILNDVGYKKSLLSDKKDALTKALSYYNLTPEQLKGITNRLSELNEQPSKN